MATDSKLNAPPLASTGSGFSFWHAFSRHWQGSVRYYGLRHTVAQVAVAAWRFFRELLPGRRKARFGDLDYDFDHEVDTTRANVGFRAQLIAALSGHQYFPTEPWLFEEMMEALRAAVGTQQSALRNEQAALSSQHSAISSQHSGHSQEIATRPALEEFTFVDLGSGKGRVLLMAAPYGFKKIIGVEFMPEWHRVAEENVSKHMESRAEIRPKELCGTGAPACAAETERDEGTDKSPIRAPLLRVNGQKSVCATKAASIELLCMDARDFDFPPGPLVVYLFNPFPEPVLAVVLDKLRQSLLDDPRPMYLAYRYPEFDGLLQRCGWLEKIAGTEQWGVWGNRRNRAESP